MNICLTISNSPWDKYAGGGHTVAHNLARQLAEMGHNVFLLYPTGRKGEYPEGLNYRTVEIGHSLGKLDPSLNIFPVWAAVQRLIWRTPIDIILGSSFEAALLHFLIKRKKRPIFTMVAHHPYTNVQWHLPQPIRLVRERILYLQKYAFEHAARVFAVSNCTKNWEVTNLGIAAEKIEVVYNGIASEFFGIPRVNKPSNEIVITTWGRLDPQKGVDILLKSLPLVLSRLSGSNMRIQVNIAGQEPAPYIRNPGYAEQYRELAEDLGVADKVSFLGRISDAELRQLLSRTSLGVFPSRVEGFGLMIGEAMAAGVPVISTNTSAIPEIVTDGETGLLVPPENSEALAEKILFAINNPLVMETIAQAGRKRMKENFTWEKVAQRYCAAFECLLNSL